MSAEGECLGNRKVGRETAVTRGMEEQGGFWETQSVDEVAEGMASLLPAIAPVCRHSEHGQPGKVQASLNELPALLVRHRHYRLILIGFLLHVCYSCYSCC